MNFEYYENKNDLDFTPAVALPVLAPSQEELRAQRDYRPKTSEQVDATVAKIEADAAELRRLRFQTPTNAAVETIAQRQAAQDQLETAQQEVERLKALRDSQ